MDHSKPFSSQIFSEFGEPCIAEQVSSEDTITPNIVATESDEAPKYVKAQAMMTRMGYVGGGLGKSGSGIAEPISINNVGSRKGLGYGRKADSWGNSDTWGSAPDTSWEIAPKPVDPSAEGAKEENPKFTEAEIDVQWDWCRDRRAPSKKKPEIRVVYIKGGVQQLGPGSSRTLKLQTIVKPTREYTPAWYFPGVVVRSLGYQDAEGDFVGVKKNDLLEIHQRAGGKKFVVINTRTCEFGVVGISLVELASEPTHRSQ